MITQKLISQFVKNSERTSDKAVRGAYGNLACVVGVLCNVLLFAGKFVVGTLFGSVSIAADAINNLSDASTNLVSLVGFQLGARPADEKHPFGHARYEYLAGLAVSVMILVIGLELLKESFGKVLHPTPVEFSWLSIAVLIASILVKLWMSAFNTTIGERIHSETLKATAVDSRNDVISTTAVLLATLVVHFTGFSRLDGIMGLLVASFILFSGVGLVRDTLDPILGAAPDPEDVAHIREAVMSYPGVLGMHDLMIHDYGPGNRLVSLHIELPAEANVLESHDLIDRIEKDFLVRDGYTCTIHYDPIVTADPHVTELRKFISAAAKEIDPDVSIHDLRIVPGKTHTNVVFDCVAPSRYFAQKGNPAAQLISSLRETVKRRWPDHFCVIQLEPSYTGSSN